MKIKNPKLSVTVNEGLGTGYYLDSSNYVHFGDKTESTEFIAVKMNDVFFGAMYEDQYMEVRDTVNCTAESGEIVITDPTKDASCTVSQLLG